MDRSIIDKIQGFGFDVYMRDPGDTYLFYTDGKRVGYLQDDRFGFSISTVHMPGKNVGTGFQMIRHAGSFTKEDLESGFAYAPSWASGRDLPFVVKYKDIKDWRSRDSWNGSFKLVEKVDV